MAFKILIDDNLKDKRVQDLYSFITGFQSVDWGLSNFNLDLHDSKCGSIPTNYGCILFPSFWYTETRFIEYAKGFVEESKLKVLKKELKEQELVDIDSMLVAEKEVVQEIVSKHPDIVESVSTRLVLPAILEVDAIPQKMEDALTLFEQQSYRLKNLLDFCSDMKERVRTGRAEPFEDFLGVHQWNLQYADPREVEEAVKLIVEKHKEESYIDHVRDKVITHLREKPKQKGYVIILYAFPDAKLTIRELEKLFDNGLAPVRQYLSKKTCFVTLMGK